MKEACHRRICLGSDLFQKKFNVSLVLSGSLKHLKLSPEQNAFIISPNPILVHKTFYRYNFICLFLAVLGLCSCVGHSLVVVRRLLISMASLVELGALGHMGLSSCTSRVLEHRLNSHGARV